jgi:hypothetical protein
MNIGDLSQLISNPEFDLEEFVRLAIDDGQLRDEIVHQMLTHRHIMVYYHCGEVVAKACQDRPDLFYPYWKDIVTLISHPNSYHRDFGLNILANLTQIDHENRFAGVFDDYFEHLNDLKFMTAVKCVQSSQKIIQYKLALRYRIINLLLAIDRHCDYPEKQKALMKCDVLEILDAVYQEASQKTEIDSFIKAQVNSLSPKTKKKAKELIRKYGLAD